MFAVNIADALDKIDADYLVQLAKQEVRISPSVECMERERAMGR